MNTHFNESLEETDADIFEAIQMEKKREEEYIELIASENVTSRAVMQAQGSVLTNKYAEGLPGKRYYSGCEAADKAENLAIERVTKLFKCNYANVQPHSGAQANQAVYLALLEPHDKILSMALDHGGHLTHGSPVNISGKWFNSVPYGVRDDDGFIDYEMVEKLALEHKPKMIVCGASAYSREIDWKRFREIADKTGSWLLADVAHYAGLIAGEVLQNPCDHAHVVTSTTHKTLRGPRGGIILWNDEDLTKKINSAVFPGYQGGPLMHVIAAKAVAFGLALKPDFKEYARQVVKNAKTLADTLENKGYKVVSGGTDTHVFLLDLRDKGIIGLPAQKSLYRAHLNCNRNAVPNDPEKPWFTSGLRVGSPASTTRGFKEEEFRQIGEWMAAVLDGLSENGEDGNSRIEQEIAGKAKNLCSRFPVYKDAL